MAKLKQTKTKLFTDTLANIALLETAVNAFTATLNANQIIAVEPAIPMTDGLAIQLVQTVVYTQNNG